MAHAVHASYWKKHWAVIPYPRSWHRYRARSFMLGSAMLPQAPYMNICYSTTHEKFKGRYRYLLSQLQITYFDFVAPFYCFISAQQKIMCVHTNGPGVLLYFLVRGKLRARLLLPVKTLPVNVNVS